jgi:hypothetical protein
MSVLAHASGFASRPVPRPIRQPGLFRRLLASFLESRRLRAEQEIAMRLGITGGHITDEIERRMSERLTQGGGFRI